jgi:hypothetical protein
VADDAFAAQDMERFQLFAYNRGVLLLFAFADYEKAVQDFERIRSDHFLWMDVQVFLAFALAKLGKNTESLSSRWPRCQSRLPNRK